MILNLNTEIGRTKAQEYLKKLIEQKAKVELRKIFRKRTHDQNAYLHVLFNIIAIEYGLTLDEAKDCVKQLCPFMHIDNVKLDKLQEYPIVILKHTSALDTKGISDLIEWMKDFFAQKGLVLPSADDYKRNWAEIDAYIAENKTWL